MNIFNILKFISIVILPIIFVLIILIIRFLLHVKLKAIDYKDLAKYYVFTLILIWVIPVLFLILKIIYIIFFK
jgi:archaellum biogenesis protein FlaJ (TadC family)